MELLAQSAQTTTERYNNQLFRFSHFIALHKDSGTLLVWQCDSRDELRIVARNVAVFKSATLFTVCPPGINPLSYFEGSWTNVKYITKDIRRSWYFSYRVPSQRAHNERSVSNVR